MHRHAPGLAFIFVVALAGCGGSGMSSPPATTTATPTKPTTSTAGSGVSPLQAEATAAAAGDIPDNQVFLTFHNTRTGYSLKYPEGWAQRGSSAALTFRDKNNIVRVVVMKGAALDSALVRRQLTALKNATIKSGPQQVTLSGSPALKVVYTTQSAPNAVTGKRVTLVVDRYYLSHAGRRAIVDLGTPVGVDNVDAYRLMIQSFHWR
ncbi:MAG: hypothetical protein QOG93_895 [Gaiellaceae bacterium]|jgi:hypothetical protein|nr:hypothetical protein [Gaiellaceae bacterium]